MSTDTEQKEISSAGFERQRLEYQRTPESRQRAWDEYLELVRNTSPEDEAVIDEAVDEMVAYIYANRTPPQEYNARNEEANAA